MAMTGGRTAEPGIGGVRGHGEVVGHDGGVLVGGLEGLCVLILTKIKSHRTKMFLSNSPPPLLVTLLATTQLFPQLMILTPAHIHPTWQRRSHLCEHHPPQAGGRNREFSQLPTCLQDENPGHPSRSGWFVTWSGICM